MPSPRSHLIAAGLLVWLGRLLLRANAAGAPQRVHGGPAADEVLGLPMSIVRTFVAPLVVAIHPAALYRLHTTRAGRTR